MEVPQNEMPGLVKLPEGGLTDRQLQLAIAQIQAHPQIKCIKRISSNELALLINVGALNGTVADQSRGLVEAFAWRRLQNASTARRLSRHNLIRV